MLPDCILMTTPQKQVGIACISERPFFARPSPHPFTHPLTHPTHTHKVSDLLLGVGGLGTTHDGHGHGTVLQPSLLAAGGTVRSSSHATPRRGICLQTRNLNKK